MADYSCYSDWHKQSRARGIRRRRLFFFNFFLFFCCSHRRFITRPGCAFIISAAYPLHTLGRWCWAVRSIFVDLYAADRRPTIRLSIAVHVLYTYLCSACVMYKYIYVHTSYVYRGECVCLCVPCISMAHDGSVCHSDGCSGAYTLSKMSCAFSLSCVCVCVLCVSFDTASLDVHIHSRGEHFLAWNSSLYISLVHYIQI